MSALRTLILALAIFPLAAPWAVAQGPPPGQSQEPREIGVMINEPDAMEGYTLVNPLGTKTVYLIDMEGQVVHMWDAGYTPGESAYLLDDGRLVRTAREPDQTVFRGGGQGGRIRMLSWEGELLWDYQFADGTKLSHHDLEPLPNGNILVVAWERRTQEEVIAAGRDLKAPRELWPDFIVEVEPVLPDGGKIVWEWHAWDHLIQDQDPNKPNHGVVAEHPERIDVNIDVPRDTAVASAAPAANEMTAEQRAMLEALGYLEAEPPTTGGSEGDEGDEQTGNSEENSTAGQEAQLPGRDGGPGRGPGGRGGPGGPGGNPGGPRGPDGDWMHTNGIDYNAELDQIAISCRHLSEIWIIDHSTSTEEARGSSGGRSGMGGDLLYRWGNPQNYHMGGPEDQRLFGQHNVHWIEPGCYGEGNLMAFNNGLGRPGSEQPGSGGFSSVDEWIPPLNSRGTYDREPGTPFGPEELEWTYDQRDPEEDDFFFSGFISGASRLPNDNTFIASGTQGRLFEITPEGDIVWSFSNGLGVEEQGRPGGPPGGRNRRTGFLAGGGPGGGAFGNNGPGLFRATRIAPDHPAIAGKDLRPLDPQPR